MKTALSRFLALTLIWLAASLPAGAACYQWSKTAASNATADASINWAEGMAPSAVNDSARAMMARLAECRDDLSGALLTTGTSVAYAVTTNQGLPSPPTDGQSIAIRLNATNGAAPTLAADSGTAYPIQSSPGVAVPTSTMTAGVPYRLTFSVSSSAWLLQDYYSITINLDQFGTTRGSVLERGSGGWVAVVPGASGTVWTSNGSGADPTYQAPAVLPPGGYLTPTSGTIPVTVDTTATSIFYSPDTSTSVPLYNGSNYVSTTFAELTISLAAASQAINGIYDVCIFSDSGTVRGVFTPVWATATVGSGSRGTGAGTPELVKVGAYWLNANSMTTNNGATSYVVPAQRCTYVGSIYVDGTAGNVTVHRSYGTDRKFGIWNAYNQRTIILKGGAAAPAGDVSTSYHPLSADTTINASSFTGLADQQIDTSAFVAGTSNTTIELSVAVGWNSTSTTSGARGYYFFPSGAGGVNVALSAKYAAAPSLGVNKATLLFKENGAATFTPLGGEQGNVIFSQWRG